MVKRRLSPILNVCVFCSSSRNAAPAYLAAARELGALLGQAGHRLIYGGGNRGMMGEAADAALAGGAEVIGVIPEPLVAYEVAHQGLTRLEIVPTMHARKARMAELSDLFLALPGGLGTWDELCEILTWRQLQFHSKPILIVNLHGYFDAFFELAERAVQEGMLHPEHRNLLKSVASVEEAVALLPLLPHESGSLRPVSKL